MMNRMVTRVMGLAVSLLLFSAPTSCYSIETQSQSKSTPFRSNQEGDPLKVSFQKSSSRLEIRLGAQPIANYVFENQAIPRPYFCQIKTLHGVPVTRPDPPDPVINKGNDDHATFHPGIWLAFGDLGGKDFWRNKAHVRQIRFIEPFVEEPGLGQFSVENEYCGDDGVVVCREVCSFRIVCNAANAYFLTSRSKFRSERSDFAFGDQEEMGVGIRLNTPLTVKFGSGRILNSDGGENEKGTWGKPAKWCAAVGNIEGAGVGIALIPASDNFRPSWFHTRDYGLIVANPFGKKSMTAPENPSITLDSTVVKRGASFTFGWGIYVVDGLTGGKPNFTQAYNECLKLMEQ